MIVLWLQEMWSWGSRGAVVRGRVWRALWDRHGISRRCEEIDGGKIVHEMYEYKSDAYSIDRILIIDEKPLLLMSFCEVTIYKSITYRARAPFRQR